MTSGNVSLDAGMLTRPTSRGALSPWLALCLNLLLVIASFAIYYPVHHQPFYYPDEVVVHHHQLYIQRTFDWQTIPC